MPLPRYQPVKKKLKTMGASLESLDDYCISKIIAYALIQSSSRDQEPYTGDNTNTERNLSLVCKKWYFLTQTQVADHGVHKIHLEGVLKREPCKHMTNKSSIRMNGAITAVKTPRRLMPSQIGSTTGGRTPISSLRTRMPNYGILSQRNMTTTTSSTTMTTANKQEDCSKDTFNIKLLQALQFKLLKYKHVQLTGTINCDDFFKLIALLNSSRIEQLDLINIEIEGARTHLKDPPKLESNRIIFGRTLKQLEVLTFTISTEPKYEPTNAMLWTIYQQATNLRELRVYLIESSNTESKTCEKTSEHDVPDAWASSSFIKRLTLSQMKTSHARLARLVFDRISSNSGINQSPSKGSTLCYYANLIKKVLSEEKNIASLETNDHSIVDYLISTSNRLCTKLELPSLTFTSPIKSLDLLYHLVRLHNLGTSNLSVAIDNIDQIGEIKTVLEGFSLKRSPNARCTLNFFLQDQKFPECEDKVKNLIQICRLADVNVHLSALQRISIDSCHLMWSTGRALQVMMSGADSIGKCIFKITLQTYPIKPNTVNPFEITIPFGKCAKYQISSTREDITRHREIMKSLKKECYHQFVKSVREINVT